MLRVMPNGGGGARGSVHGSLGGGGMGSRPGGGSRSSVHGHLGAGGGSGAPGSPKASGRPPRGGLKRQESLGGGLRKSQDLVRKQQLELRASTTPAGGEGPEGGGSGGAGGRKSRGTLNNRGTFSSTRGTFSLGAGLSMLRQNHHHKVDTEPEEEQAFDWDDFVDTAVDGEDLDDLDSRFPVLVPGSRAALVGDLCGLLAVVFVAFWTPYRVAFVVHGHVAYDVVEDLITLLFLGDVILRFNTAFRHENGVLERRR